MSDPGYFFRGKRIGAPTEFRATADALIWRDGENAEKSLPYTGIRKIRVYRSEGVHGNPDYLACVIVPARGPGLSISSYHFGGDGTLESRADPYRSFERALFERAVKANPAIAFVRGGRIGWFLMAAFLAIAAVLVGSVLYSTVMGLIKGPASQDAWITLVFCLLLVLLAIPGVWLLRKQWPKPFDPFAG